MVLSRQAQSPGERGRFQIDYILIKNRFWNSVKCAKTYPGAGIFSDHNLVAAEINIKLKKLHRTCQRQSWNMDKLKNDDFVAMEYRCNVNIALEEGVTGRWVCDDRFYGLVNRSNR